ncbi:MAG: Hsp70 family protein [Byssovorax sp.]
MSRARLAVGIDLGTTHTVVAWADPERDEAAQIFPVPQLVAAGEVEARPLLPSALYAPLPGEELADLWGDAPWVVGELARRRGGEVPGRLVASSKSWLCHPRVDRGAAILPWGAGEDAPDLPRISPIDAGARCLSHVAAAWDQAFPGRPLAAQDVVLTVPASFDEAARELTVEAARRAGLGVRLLEEPQAAFYDYLASAGSDGLGALLDAKREGGDTALVLVCDVGGGTTDLSLIEVRPGAAGQRVELRRVAVGHHLLLGGDNMDLALAHLAEGRMVAAPTKLDPARFGQLVLACRAAKERLLGERPPDEAKVTVLGQGARLLGGALTARLGRDEVERVVLDGFFPAAPRDARPERARGGLVAFGLPYERDPAVTRHVAHFFARHAEARGPSAILLNGGVFRATAIADRLIAAIEAWGGPALARLPNGDPDLAVARGAVAYALSLSGRDPRIRGGTARGYYVGLEAPQGGGPRPAICVVPRGAEEGVPHLAAGRTLALIVGRPVRFDLFASDEAEHESGAIVALDDDRFDALPPVAVSFEKGAGEGKQAGEVKVELTGELSAIGTLDLACVEVGDGPLADRRRFRLALQLREGGEGAASAASAASASAGARGKKLDEAREALDRVFGKGRADVGAREVKDLLRELERLLGERGTWSIEQGRALFDALAQNRKSRRRSADHERVFWLLAGFTLRPGFGDPGDPARIALMAPLFAERLAFPDEPRAWQQLWIAWRRMAGGLDEATQTAMRDTLDPLLAPASARLKKPKGWKLVAEGDLLDLCSSLERVPPARKSELGGWILERTWTDRDPRLWAALGRLGARVPTYASVHQVITPSTAERWLDHLLREKWETLPSAIDAAVRLARVTGDRARDLSERARREASRKLTANGARSEQVRAVEELVPVAEAERAAFFGEGLPVGLKLIA